ncbi:MAG: P-loop NTPase, partial [Alistipes sp.]|nr:P-loop NTPase [Alistipes sp.]
NVNIPVLGFVENMAWFTPAELPDNKYFIFGEGGAERYAAECGVDFLGHIPIIQSVMEGGDKGLPAASSDSAVGEYYRHIAKKVVEKL